LIRRNSSQSAGGFGRSERTEKEKRAYAVFTAKREIRPWEIRAIYSHEPKGTL
jgi:hypothetical protein